MLVHQSFLRLFNVMRSRLIHVLLRLQECKEVHAHGNRSIYWNRLVIRRWNSLEYDEGMQCELARAVFVCLCAVYVCAKERIRWRLCS